jgi:N-acetylneuraminic acid mutarotase
VLLFGGVSGTTLLNETWYWNGSSWLQLTTPTSLVARSNAAIAYNGTKVVLFGGACGVPIATTTRYLNDTWNWNPGTKTWAAVTGPNQPSAWAGAMLAKDAAGKLLLWGGRDATD